MYMMAKSQICPIKSTTRIAYCRTPITSLDLESDLDSCELALANQVTSVLLITASSLPVTRRKLFADRSFAPLPGAVRHPCLSAYIH